MSPHVGIGPQIIQYADDTLIIYEAQPNSLKIISKVLEVYIHTDLTGLKINKEKSSFVPIAMHPSKSNSGHIEHYTGMCRKTANQVLRTTANHQEVEED